MKKRLTFITVLMLFCSTMFGQYVSHWGPVPTNMENSKEIWAKISIDGVPQESTNIEIGAFCGDELRGATKIQKVGDDYVVFLAIWSDKAYDIINFKLYDPSSSNDDVELLSDYTVSFNNIPISSPGNYMTLDFVPSYWNKNDIVNYESNMTVEAFIAINGIPQDRGNLEVAALCGDELRDVLRPIYDNRYNKYVASFVIHGVDSEVIKFQLYDHSEDAITALMPLESYYTANFEIDATIGIENPITINFACPIAQIKETEEYFYTLEEAVAAATGGQTIALLCDAEGAGVVINKEVTIDFGGHTYTFNEGEVISIQEGGVATFVNDANIAEGVELFGGQLYTTNGNLTIVAKKNVVASSSWSTLSAPTAEGIAAFSTSTGHDFYQYVESAENEWNYIGNMGSDNSYTMQAGRGYLYANTANTEVSFTGTLNYQTVTYPLTYTQKDLAGFHLIGNPFTHNISFAHLSGNIASGYYVVGEDNEFIPVEPTTSTEVIAPFQAVLVQATEKDDYFSINKEAVSATREVSNGVIEIVATNGSYSDVAYVSFNEGYGLEKMAHNNANVPMVYLPVGDKNYAIAKYNQDVNEIPVSFVAQTMGEYTIGVKLHDCAFESMYLTDRMTGERVNLLMEDYTFVATSNDNADRFMLTFATTGVEETKEESYIFINNDNMIINNVAGDAIVRIVDMMGRVVAVYNVNESASISTSSLNSGVYVIQMSDDNGVKVQKVVIE